MNKKFLLAFAAIFIYIASSATVTVKLSSGKAQSCKTWVDNVFAKGSLPPFSFCYDGKPSSSFITKWKFETVQDASDDCFSKYVWTDPAGTLQVSCEVKTFNDFNAVEWLLRFKNLSSADSAPISDVKVFDVNLQDKNARVWELCYANGSMASKEDFMARDKKFSVGDKFEMSPYGGRSSSHSFPFFNVRTGNGGAVFAIGWTGTWLATMNRTSDDNFTVTTGMKFLDTFLHPSEEIRTPSTAMLLWQGDDRMDGQNLFRHFLLAHHHPTVSGGKAAKFPIFSSFNYGDPSPCNEYSCMTTTYAKALIKRYEQFGILPDCFWLDAGWYEGASKWKEGYNWYNTTGNWVVDTERFPNGMGEISDAAHAVGAKFMVWFEPERVNRSSYWAHQHPEFLLNATGKPAQAEDAITEHSHIVNLGDPDALAWMTESVKTLIRDNKIDYYRQDYNLDPEGFFLANDEPGRRGICEIRYICGLYKFWDDLRAEFPDLLIDNCSSGGRRIDLETTSRSAPMWRTDYNYGEPIGYQCHTYGLSQWLPVSGTGVSKCDPFTFRSSFSWSVITNWSVTSHESNILEMQRCLKEFKSVREYFTEDYYPLTGYGNTTGDDIWLAYQLNRVSDGTGYVVAFRRKDNTQTSVTVRLRGLDKDSIYTIENQDTGLSVDVSGMELSEGYQLSLENPQSSLLLKYCKK